MKKHLRKNDSNKSSFDNYACNANFYQMPISERLTRKEFERTLIEKPDCLCKKCINIFKSEKRT